MIAYLTGKVMPLQPGDRAIIVLAQNVGYKVSITTDLASALVSGQEVSLFIYTAVREDAISLYGFSKKEELAFFEQLLTVSGVGPKIALEILSAPLSITQTAIMNEDAALLTKVKGIGRKTAERIIIELKNKIIPKDLYANDASHPALRHHEAILALESLGYDKMQIMKALTHLPPEVQKTEDVIKFFLKRPS